MIEPPRWTPDELLEQSNVAKELFRKQRIEEPLEDYLEEFDKYQGDVEDLLETTVDLTNLTRDAIDVLTSKKLLHAFRYLAGPPISVDDLKTVADAAQLNAKQLRANSALVERVIQVVLMGLDRRRFPWITEHREPTEAERHAAILASTALMATQRVGTRRRSEGKQAQEARVEVELASGGLAKVDRRKVQTFADAPNHGHFCGESY